MATRYVSVSIAAKGAGVCSKTIRRWCAAQQIEAKITPSGAQWRVLVDDDGFPVRR